jgi:undecaprenyl-diphosphatase
MNLHIYHFLKREHAWCLRANAWADNRLIRRYFQTVSRLGDGIVWYLLGTVIFLAEGMKSLPVIFHLACIVIVTTLMYRYLKQWTRRPRPFSRDQRIHLWTAPLDEFSFPSGHTLHAVSLSAVTIAYYPMLGIVLIPLTISIALSRIVLGLHYPSDVLAAIAIGTLTAWVSFLIF